LTEIDIQTPIPAVVQERRKGKGFLFVGCRFNDQLSRSFARQIMKRSSDTHWAVLPDEPTRMEARFLEEQGITRIAMPLAEFAAQLTEALQAETA
ncbi:MAG: SIR2 family protein, partial [Hydrogenophaga sp.]|nr:SIR2 family protein [Hydrogenophaga sp.]